MYKQKCITFLVLTIVLDASHSLRIPRDSESDNVTSTLKTIESNLKSLEPESPVNLAKSENESHKNNITNKVSVDPNSATQTSSKLFEMLNSTLLDVNTLILDAMRNASVKRNEEFERLGGLVRNVQSLISERKTGFSTDASHQLISSLQNIQTFFTENEKHLQEHIMNRNGNFSRINPIDLKNASDGSSQRGGRRNGPLDDLMRITSQMGQGLTAKARSIENTLTSSVNQIQTQIQTQIQNFVQGINNFFTSAGNIFQLPNLLNLNITQS